MQHLEERRCKWSHVKVNWEEQQRMNCFTSSRKEPSFSFWHDFGDIHKLIDLFISKLNNWFFSIVNVRDIFFICIQLFFHQIILTLILLNSKNRALHLLHGFTLSIHLTGFGRNLLLEISVYPSSCLCEVSVFFYVCAISYYISSFICNLPLQYQSTF